jgi:hypothetical protein
VADKSSKGHTALDYKCPLHKNYKTIHSQTGDSSDKEATNVCHAVLEFETAPPIPSLALTAHAPKKADRVNLTSVRYGDMASCGDNPVLLSCAESPVVALIQPMHIDDDDIYMTTAPPTIQSANPF